MLANSKQWPYRLVVRTAGFQSVNQSSILCRVTATAASTRTTMTNIKNRDRYPARLKELAVDKKCGFCNLNREFILKIYTHWIWVYSEFPYWKHNTIVISKNHKVKFADLLPEELAELKTIFIEAENAFIKSGIIKSESNWGMDILWRQRASIEGYETRSHIHIHLCPNREGLYNPILDPEAHLIDTSLLRKVL